MCDNPVPFSEMQSATYQKYKKYGSVKLYMDSLQLPCGNCLGCRIDKLTLWTARCNYEQIKGANAFVTFTYDDYHLPYNDGSLFPTLKQEHFHKYMDNIRHKIKSMPILPPYCRKDFSYFASGEYGDTFNRPHYHVLFFGLDFMAFKKLFDTTWKNGFIKSLPLTSGGVRYVVDYFTKNLVTGEKAEKEYDNKGIERPFKSSSRGLGSELFYTHRDEIRNGDVLKIGSRIIPVPSYYKNLFCSFSDSEVQSRLNFNRENYDRVVKESERLGFPSPDRYIKYIAKANELALSKKLHDKGVANLPSFKEIDNFSDTQNLVQLILNK